MNMTPRILLVEDDRVFSTQVLEAYREKYDIKLIHSKDTVIGYLEEGHHFDLIILDLHLTENSNNENPDGLELLSKIRMIHTRIPVLIYTGDERRETTYKVIKNFDSTDIAVKGELGFEELSAKIDTLITEKNERKAINSTYISFHTDLIKNRDFRTKLEKQSTIYFSENLDFGLTPKDEKFLRNSTAVYLALIDESNLEKVLSELEVIKQSIGLLSCILLVLKNQVLPTEIDYSGIKKIELIDKEEIKDEKIQANVILHFDEINSLKDQIMSNIGYQKIQEIKSIKRIQSDDKKQKLKSLNQLRDYYILRGEKVELPELERQISESTLKVQFIENSLNTPKIKGIRLDNILLFKNTEWSPFSPTMNILLGKNGYGKSLLMRLILIALVGDRHSMEKILEIEKKMRSRITPDNIVNESQSFNVKLSNDIDIDINEKKLKLISGPGRIPVLGIGALRLLDEGANEEVRHEGYDSEDFRTNILFQGANHFIHKKIELGRGQSLLSTLINRYTAEITKAGKVIDKKAIKEIPIFRLITEIITRMTGRAFEFFHVGEVDGALDRMEILVQMDDNNEHPIPIQYLSMGMQSVIYTFSLIYFYLEALHLERKKVNLAQDDLHNEAGIVFIDEIDAHLHPDWQQKIVNLLRDQFPNVQFFLAAHSPLIVSGCWDGEVAILRKINHKDSHIQIQVYRNHFIGWLVSELLGHVYHIEEKDDTLLRYSKMRFREKEMREELNSLYNAKMKGEGIFDKNDELRIIKLENELAKINKIKDLISELQSIEL